MHHMPAGPPLSSRIAAALSRWVRLLRLPRLVPLLVVAALWYIVMTSVLSVLQQYVERRFDRGARAGR